MLLVQPSHLCKQRKEILAQYIGQLTGRIKFQFLFQYLCFCQWNPHASNPRRVYTRFGLHRDEVMRVEPGGLDVEVFLLFGHGYAES